MDNTRFSHIRKAVLRWSQQRLADELGMARNTITRMESGVMPVERRTELAVRWLMFRECNIVEQVDQAKQAPDCNIVEQVDQGEQFLRSVLSDEALTCGEVDYFFTDALERWRIVHAEFPALATDAGFRSAYASWGPKVWLNIRSLRAAVREHLKIPF